MIAAVLMLVLATGPIMPEDMEKDCEVEACSAETMRMLWIAERGAREEWEKTAAVHELVIKNLRAELYETQVLVAAVRSARLAESAPVVPDRGLPASCLWLAAGSFAAGALAGGGVAALVLRMEP